MYSVSDVAVFGRLGGWRHGEKSEPSGKVDATDATRHNFPVTGLWPLGQLAIVSLPSINFTSLLSCQTELLCHTGVQRKRSRQGSWIIIRAKILLAEYKEAIDHRCIISEVSLLITHSISPLNTILAKVPPHGKSIMIAPSGGA